MCRWEVAQGIGETWRKACAKKEARAEGMRPADWWVEEEELAERRSGNHR